MDEVLFTSAAVADLISQLDEYQGKTVHITDTPAGAEIVIDNATYNIPYQNAEEVQVDEAALEEVTDVLDDAYSRFETDEVLFNGVGAVHSDEPADITSGILKEVAKTLLVGGLVRLTTKLLK